MRTVLISALLLGGACQRDHVGATQRSAASDAATPSPPDPHAQTIRFFCQSIGLARSAVGYQLNMSQPSRVEDCPRLESRMRQADALLVGYQLGSSAVLAVGDFRTDELPTVELEEAVAPTVAACTARRFEEVSAKLASLRGKCDAALDKLLAVCSARGWIRPDGANDGGAGDR